MIIKVKAYLIPNQLLKIFKYFLYSVLERERNINQGKLQLGRFVFNQHKSQAIITIEYYLSETLENHIHEEKTGLALNHT